MMYCVPYFVSIFYIGRSTKIWYDIRDSNIKFLEGKSLIIRVQISNLIDLTLLPVFFVLFCLINKYCIYRFMTLYVYQIYLFGQIQHPFCILYLVYSIKPNSRRGGGGQSDPAAQNSEKSARVCTIIPLL